MRITLALLFFCICIKAQLTYCDTPIEINLSTQANAAYNWDINGYISTERDGTLVVNEAQSYTIELTVFNEYGCTNTDKRTLQVEQCKDWTYYAPNAFVPEGENKTWTPVGENIVINLITIYTREGQIVYEGIEPWTGDKIIGGVYVYTCDYTTISGLKLRDLGRVTLVR